MLLLERHGLLAVGGSFEQAYLRMELVEHQAKIAMNAKAIGDVRRLPQSEIEALSKKGRPASSPLRNVTDGDATVASSVATAPRQADVSVLVNQALKRFS